MEKGKNGGKEVPRPHTGQHTDDIRKVGEKRALMMDCKEQ